MNAMLALAINNETNKENHNENPTKIKSDSTTEMAYTQDVVNV